MLRICFLSLVLGIVAAKDSYVIIVTDDVRPGVPLNISVNILHASSDVSVTAKLIKKSDSTVISSNQGSFQQDMPGNLMVSVPDSLASGGYKLTVEGSQGLTFTNSTDLHYQSKSLSIFVQTDKAMYKPGQTVHYRAFAIYPNLTVYLGPMDIDIYDPSSNKIKQLRGVRDASGVYTNFMIMDSKPVLGDWKITIHAHGQSKEKQITIAEYVLPKFEVTVELPSFSLTSDNSIAATVKAKYTYGKPVKGTVTLRAKLDHWYRPYNYHGAEPMVEHTMDINGEAKYTIPLDVLKAHNSYWNGKKVVVEANVTESLTKMKLKGSSTVQFYSHAEKIEFLPSNPTTFKPGLKYTAYVSVSRQDDSPLTGVKSALTIDSSITYELPAPNPTPLYYFSPQTGHYKLPVKSFTVPDSGVIAAEIVVPHNASNIQLTAHYGGITAYKSLSKMYSPSSSYVQLELQSTHLQAGSGHTAGFSVKSTTAVHNLAYQVISRGSIVYSGVANGGNSKTFNFQVPLNSKMAPNARIVAYFVRSDGEIVTDSISFDVDGTFSNQVSIDFDKSKAQPGEGINVEVRADPTSLVNLLAVDQSVLLLKSGNDITQDEVIDELKTYDTIKVSSPFGGFGGGGIGIMPEIVGRKKRMIFWPYPTFYGGSDARQVFNNVGVKVLTDANVYHHVEPHHYYYPQMAPMMDGLAGGAMPAGAGMAVGGFGGGGGGGAFAPIPNGPVAGGAMPVNSPLKEVGKVRSHFYETWLWMNETVGADGRVSISATVPDTITSWVASAFAVHSTSGLGIAGTKAKVQAFRPFFVSLNLPYSVVRGEQLVLEADVFNYMDQDMSVLVTLEQSNDFTNIVMDANGNEQYVTKAATNTVQVKAGEAKSVYFPVVPSGLGSAAITVKAQSSLAADAVKRQLLIEPEGVAKEYNTPVLVDLKHDHSFTETVDVTLPAGVVAGSQRVKVSVIGDLMGPTVNGLDKLLRMPTGCGEQTMLGFAPDVFVTNYLTDTNQLTGDVEEKAISYMEKGYQRELTFQHKDGSFSAFGDRDNSGSMWLTAFVAKSFHQAKRHIYIDDGTLTRAIDWMINRQNANGSFPEPGRIIHKDAQGGSAASLTSMTSFVLIALLENNDLQGGVQHRIQTSATKAKTYLESQIDTISDPYTLSITTYALNLAHSSRAASSFTTLKSRAVVKDGMSHWHEPESAMPSTSHHYWSPPHKQSKPIDIEMTSYGLLVYAGMNMFTEGLPVMKWITKQRNPNGGFASTQDTVLALQSLSEFARIAYSDQFNMQISITAGQTTKQFPVTPQNALVLQSIELPSVPSSVAISATGNGMCLVEVSVFFNVEAEIEEPSFEVDVTLVEETKDKLTIKTCSKWLKSGASGMAVQEIGVPSGFAADTESIGDIPTLKKIETEDRKVILYFDEINTQALCVTMDAIRTGLVAKSQPAPIRLYDYYEPTNQVTKFYQSQLLKNTSVCDVCAECECPGHSRR